MRVLVVDDDAAVREMLALILEIEGAEVVPCASAGEAVKALAESQVELVITDMWMETPTAGLQVVAVAAQLPNPPPVVVLTAFPVRASEVSAHGPATIMQKGSDPMGMIHQLRGILALARRPVERADEQDASEKRKNG